MTTDRTEVRDLQEGSYVMIEDEPCIIDSYSTSKPGKHGSAKARIEGQGVFDGKRRTLTEPVDATITVPRVGRKQGQVVSADGREVQVMDLESYDTFVMKFDEEHGLTPDDEIEFLEFEDRRRLTDDWGVHSG